MGLGSGLGGLGLLGFEWRGIGFDWLGVALVRVRGGARVRVAWGDGSGSRLHSLIRMGSPTWWESGGRVGVRG